MLATNPSPGLSQFPINLMHNNNNSNNNDNDNKSNNKDSMRNCTTPTGRSLSPKSTDENISLTTTTSSPSLTPNLMLNNNNNNNNNDKDKLNDNLDNKLNENIFDNITLLTQNNLWNNINNEHQLQQQQQEFLNAAALYAMAQQPLNGQTRDTEILQQLMKQHTLLQQSFQSNNSSLAMQLQQQINPQQLINSVASSSTTSTLPNQQKNSLLQQQKIKHEIKNETGQSPDKKRGYPYTFQYCVLCQKNVHSSKLPCHIRQCHVGKPMFQCPACDFTSTYSKNNVKSHMVSLHGITGDPISYMDDYADQVEEFMKKCFPNVRGRARPFPGRNNNNNNNNNNNVSSTSNNNNKNIQNNQKITKQRVSTTNNSVLNNSKISSDQSSASSSLMSISPSSLLSTGSNNILLPKFPLFNALQNVSNIDISLNKSLYSDIKDEIIESSSMTLKNENKITNFNKDKKYNEISCNNTDDNNKAIYTNFIHHFVRDSDIKGTIFETFTNSSDLIDRIDLSEISICCENNNNHLLNDKQIESIAEIRKQLPKKDFEIMYALYKCDTTLLSLQQIRLIKSIAPSEVDAKRFKQFCETNSVNTLSEEEKFVIELSTIEQLFTRLKVMEITHSYPDILFNLQQEVNAYLQGAINLRHDTLLALILQCSTIYINFLCGDFGAQLIHGIKIGEAIKVCQHELPNGIKIGKKIADMLPIHGMSDSVSKKLDFYKELSQYSFSTLENRVEKFSNAILQLEAEKAALGIESNSQNTGIVVEEAKLREALYTAQNQMNDTLHFYAELSTPTSIPENFFQTVTQLLNILS